MPSTPALIITGDGVNIDNSLPGYGHADNSLPNYGRPDQGLPNYGRPDQGLPGGRRGRPDQGLPPPVGTWPPRPAVWPPIPPISVDIDEDAGVSLPIYLPGSINNDLPPVTVKPGRPENPIVLPEPPESGVLLALIIPLPMAEPKEDGAKPALLWYGPGTIPQVVELTPPGTPKQER